MADAERLTLALVGYGYWGPNLLRNFMEFSECRVKYVCDRSPIQLEKAALKYPHLLLTQSFDEVTDDDEVDAVVIATPISTHHALAKKALLRGKHVFVEKPLAADSASAEELVGLAEMQNLILMVGHTFKYNPPVIKIKELIDTGELGDIYYISSSRVNLGLHQPDVSVIWDLAPHDLSMLFYWLNEEPLQVHAFGRGCLRPDKPDVVFINLAFESGAVAELQLSWLSPVKLRRTVIVGSKKMLIYDDTESVEKVKLFDHGVNLVEQGSFGAMADINYFVEPSSFGEFQLSYRCGDIISPHLDNYEPLQALAKHLVECILDGRRPKTDGLDGLRVVRALERAESSLMCNGNFVENERWRTRLSG
ncbi:MAG: Gfo/Idh/MocA family oxidoreductase [Actinobacteria bacterium]|nr:Gfo/Idh/MocA family oxidoreductase [Actinomycetota bacterium]